jgi:hypothetical protein
VPAPPTGNFAPHGFNGSPRVAFTLPKKD